MSGSIPHPSPVVQMLDFLIGENTSALNKLERKKAVRTQMAMLEGARDRVSREQEHRAAARDLQQCCDAVGDVGEYLQRLRSAVVAGVWFSRAIVVPQRHFAYSKRGMDASGVQDLQPDVCAAGDLTGTTATVYKMLAAAEFALEIEKVGPGRFQLAATWSHLSEDYIFHLLEEAQSAGGIYSYSLGRNIFELCNLLSANLPSTMDCEKQ